MMTRTSGRTNSRRRLMMTVTSSGRILSLCHSHTAASLYDVHDA